MKPPTLTSWDDDQPRDTDRQSADMTADEIAAASRADAVRDAERRARMDLMFAAKEVFMRGEREAAA